jgi:hypothetical protein
MDWIVFSRSQRKLLTSERCSTPKGGCRENESRYAPSAARIRVPGPADRRVRSTPLQTGGANYNLTYDVQGLAGLSDASPEGLLSTGLTIAGFIPGAGQVASVGSIIVDTCKTAKAIGQCH